MAIQIKKYKYISPIDNKLLTIIYSNNIVTKYQLGNR